MVQPDVFIVCDEDKQRNKCIYERRPEIDFTYVNRLLGKMKEA